jgi:hypothetical protein
MSHKAVALSKTGWSEKQNGGERAGRGIEVTEGGKEGRRKDGRRRELP